MSKCLRSAKLLQHRLAGRAVPAAAILLAVYAFGSKNTDVAVIWTSISVGVFGLALQWALLPLVVYRVENLKKHEDGFKKSKSDIYGK